MTTLRPSLKAPTFGSPPAAAARRLPAFSCRAFPPSAASRDSSLPCYTPKTPHTPPEAPFVGCYFKGKEAKERAFPRFCAGFCQCHTFSISKHPHVQKSPLSSCHVSLPRPQHGPLLSQPGRYPGPSSISSSALGVGGFSSRAPCPCTHPSPPIFPHKHTPNLPFQSNVQLEEVGSHIALSFGKEKTGSFYLRRKDSEELPSGEKTQQTVQNRKGFQSPRHS